MCVPRPSLDSVDRTASGGKAWDIYPIQSTLGPTFAQINRVRIRHSSAAITSLWSVVLFRGVTTAANSGDEVPNFTMSRWTPDTSYDLANLLVSFLDIVPITCLVLLAATP